MLHGVDTDPVLVMTEGLFMSNKVMGVVQGRLDLHGKPIATPWTTLAQTAGAGDNEIVLI